MPTFRYQALNTDDQPITGEVEADTPDEAVVQLEREGLRVVSVLTCGNLASLGRHVPPAGGQPH